VRDRHPTRTRTCCHDLIVGEFEGTAYRSQSRYGCREGCGLGEVEVELIDAATDEKAALWLLAWSMQPPSRQLAEVEAHIEQLLRTRAA
jgi:hypothetical protein